MGAASRQRSSPLLIRSSRFFEQKRHSNASAPPYSPDLAPSDFHLFPQLKSYLKGNRYDGVEEVQRVTTRVLRDLSSGGFRGCFQSWIQRWRRCIELEGDYCEGL
nr:unnamed protein product [Callosobruchus chinensis]